MTLQKTCRKILAIAAIIMGGFALGTESLVIAKLLTAVSVSLNSASLYLLKDE